YENRPRLHLCNPKTHISFFHIPNPHSQCILSTRLLSSPPLFTPIADRTYSNTLLLSSWRLSRELSHSLLRTIDTFISKPPQFSLVNLGRRRTYHPFQPYRQFARHQDQF